ncbi:MAG: hypothetical protein ACREGE_01840 [Candidatus Microsaccharimonas sp.]
MCGRCEGDPYRGVKALFNGDLQAKDGFEDREDWTVLSPNVIVHLGASALPPEVNALFRGCKNSTENLDPEEQIELVAMARKLGRPAFGRP